MKAINIVGRLIQINEPQKFDSGFEKQEIIIDTEEEGAEYPNPLKVEFHKTEKIALVDNLRVGMNVDIACNLRGNAHNDNHFINLVAWKIVKAEEGDAPF